ncbi:MAG: metalloregulator ArsR/SmtB family transcription factor [Halieaceae bacterium]|jgi:ArsR family transcriptional regulator|nr:metalloregulator ArsR/SmtB family transcription factor [Halieaceae bacterium]
MTSLNPLTTLEFSSGADAATDLAGLFKALGDALRLDILRVMRGDSFSVSELCDVFELRQSALSHHLKVLVNADWLTRRREGTAIYYRRQLPTGPEATLREQIINAIDDQPLSAEHREKLDAIQRSREQNSLAFFRDNVARFREQQELIASWDDYSAASLHILDTAQLAADAKLLEIGPGDGRLLPQLATRCSRVIALDNSPAMLESARANVGERVTDSGGKLVGARGNGSGPTGTHISYVLGDTQKALNEGIAADGIVMNMVLHHTPNPKQVLAEAAQLLRPEGVLVISELCAHDQGWARDHCGDLWLGFEADELAGWAEDAGLTHRARLFIAQRNGFQIQVQLFQRASANKGSEA